MYRQFTGKSQILGYYGRRHQSQPTSMWFIPMRTGSNIRPIFMTVPPVPQASANEVTTTSEPFLYGSVSAASSSDDEHLRRLNQHDETPLSTVGTQS